MTEMKNELPTRKEAAKENTWDLEAMFATPEAWENAFQSWCEEIPKYETFCGTFAQGAEKLKAFLDFDTEFSRRASLLGTYMGLKFSQDVTNSESAQRRGRFLNAASRANQASSFADPEILALQDSVLKSYIEDSTLSLYRRRLERLAEEKPHRGSAAEEHLLSMMGEMCSGPSQTFTQLNNSDLKFGTVTLPSGEKTELSHSLFTSLQRVPERNVRREAFESYFGGYDSMKNTLSSNYASSVQQNVFFARAGKFSSARENALFDERIPQGVYDNLVSTVRKNLPKLHEYYEVLRRIQKYDEIHFYDLEAPIFPEPEAEISWDEAVKMVLEAVQPLGDEYVSILRKGLIQERWCDRYENVGKQSGAFSAGCYDSHPYILMNYRPEMRWVFTLAHEAGHSMHSYFSRKNQPYTTSHYRIFVAEVASTFNEELMSRFLMERATDKKTRLALINRSLDLIRQTIFRQTMFAEYERDVHAAAEAGEALTTDFFLSTYRRLLEAYFGPKFALDELLSRECLRVPHFYNAFYVYKYATGHSAAIALSQRVLRGGPKELSEYLGFLKAGGSKDPLEILCDAGVDMRTPAPIQSAMEKFGELVHTLETCMK